MPDIEVTISSASECDLREFARISRAWFDCIVESLEPAALRFLRDQCLRAERTPANVEIVATIDRQLANLRAVPPRGS